MERSYRTNVGISVPVIVDGYYDQHGEYHVEAVNLQLPQNADVMARLGVTDIEVLKFEMEATYQSYVSEFGKESFQLERAGL